MKNSLYLFVFSCLLFSSCQLSKNIGACPDFKQKETPKFVQKTQKKKNKVKKEKHAIPTEEGLDLLAGNFDIATLVASIIEEDNGRFNEIPDSICPMVILRDKSTIVAEVVKMKGDSIYLQTCDSIKNEFVLSKSQVHSIEYNPDEVDLDAIEIPDVSTQQVQEEIPEDMVIYNGEYYSTMEMAELERAEKWGKLALGLGLGGLLFLPIGIFGLIYGNKSTRIYRKYPNYKQGKNAAIAGKIIGIVFLALVLLYLLALGFVALLFGF